jgi:hypothetical protein
MMFKFQYLTQFVNNNQSDFVGGAQFQSLRGYFKENSGWIFEFHFYPSLLKNSKNPLLLAADRAQGVGFYTFIQSDANFEKKHSMKTYLEQQGFRTRKSPIENYLRSHFLNQRVLELRLGMGSESFQKQLIEIVFSIDQQRICFLGESLDSALRKSSSVLWVECPDSKPKAFRNRVELGLLDVNSETESFGFKSKGVEENKISRTQKSWMKLLARVENDIHSTEEQIKIWKNLVDSLSLNPDFLFQFDAWPENLQKMYLENFSNSRPSFTRKEERKGLIERIFNLYKKFQRRLSGAQKRYHELQNMGEEKYFAQKQKKSPALKAQAFLSPVERPQKKPGLWVHVEELDLWARVGRSASENAELFRQARSRDLWFHIKGYPGAHVWIPRGQKNFGAKAEISNQVIEQGCLLALVNSRTKLGSRESGEIEYTEKFNLKSVKGKDSQGTLIVQRSKTKFVSNPKKPLKE